MLLHTLARNGDITAAEALLQNGADVNEPDPEEGLTPLMHAARSPLAGVDMLRLLVEHGADVNAAGSPPPPPSLEWLKNLPEDLKKEMPDVSMEDLAPIPKAVLYYAIEGAVTDKIKYLVSAGASLHYQDSNGYGLLIDATYKLKAENRYSTIKWLIEQGAPINGLSRHGESALSAASMNGYFDVARLLLDAGADAGQLRWTPLMQAAVFGNSREVEALLQNKAYDTQKDRFGRTAFLLAARAGKLENARVLLEAGAKLDERDRLGQTALMHAAAADHADLAAWLLKQGAPVDAADGSGQTALMHACSNKAEDVVLLLLEAGADWAAENSYEETAIALTVDPEIASLLIGRGADWNDANTELRRALAGLPANYALQISHQDYLAGRKRRFGQNNPERMDVPFWKEMIRSGAPAAEARAKFGDSGFALPGTGEPVWCYARFGQSFNVLPDGRVIGIGGEHEDFYDPDFCIYNDVVVFDGKGAFDIYGYPREVFPPTDFHTATLAGDYIYIIGSLGYMKERNYGSTPVYRLDTRSFIMERLETTGTMPGWIYKHRATLLPGEKIKVTGGVVCQMAGREEQSVDNAETFILDLALLQWEQAGRQE